MQVPPPEVISGKLSQDVPDRMRIEFDAQPTSFRGNASDDSAKRKVCDAAPAAGSNGLDALLGVALVAQLPSQQAEVVFQYPPPESQSGPGGEDSSGGIVHKAPAAQDGCDDTSSLGSLSKHMRIASATDLLTGECFGVPSPIFAKLMLPDEELCNRPFYLEMDAGHQETSHRHGPLSHLLFVSFPCYVAEFCKQVRSSRADVMKVQRFNVVHVLDSRRTGRQDAHTSTLWEVSAHLARALASEEAREGYLSQQIKILRSSPQDWDALECMITESRSLARLLIDMFNGVRRQGYKSLWVNGCILCQVSVFPKHAAPAPPSDEQALALTCPREELLQELPLDSAEIVRYVINAIAPTVSLGELMVRLALPLSTLQRISQHLVYWKKARVVDVFRRDTRVAVAPGVDTSPDSPASTRFHEWQKRCWSKSSTQNRPSELTFSEVVNAFSGGHSLDHAREQLSPGVDFDKLLEWLVAEDLLVQLAIYYRFLPSRADPTNKDALELGALVNSKIRRQFCPNHLTEQELRLLASRAEDELIVIFFCRFVVEFARAHCRIDGNRFKSLANSIDSVVGLQKAEKLLAANHDIFIRYVCRC